MAEVKDFNVYLEVDGRQVAKAVREENRFDAAALAQSALERENPGSKVEVASVSEIRPKPA